MARGWESKAVEEQMAAAADRKPRHAVREWTEAERALQAKRANLELARAKVLQDLQTACDRRHRAMLEQALADLDEALR